MIDFLIDMIDFLIVLWSREHRLEPLIVEELLYESDLETMH